MDSSLGSGVGENKGGLLSGLPRSGGVLMAKFGLWSYSMQKTSFLSLSSLATQSDLHADAYVRLPPYEENEVILRGRNIP